MLNKYWNWSWQQRKDAFIDWEESTEPGEQEGKGVALKSCTQFFQVHTMIMLFLLLLEGFTLNVSTEFSLQWLKTAEPEDDAEDQQKVEDAPASAQPQKVVYLLIFPNMRLIFFFSARVQHWRRLRGEGSS